VLFRSVEPDSPPADFPVGSVAVCRFASPQLSPIVRRAAAIITDIGSPTGHLATIVREYRTPAIFGAGDATRLLPEGLTVTVDAEEKRVYAGIIHGLLNLQTTKEEPDADVPEMRLLRRLLAWIAPIDLVDPDSSDFAAENCRTFHDILRFCHEKAVEALIGRHEAPGGLQSLKQSLLLQNSLPIKIHIIDLGNGILPQAEPGSVRIEEVRSRPFRALLAGLLTLGAWDREPAPFGLRDLMAGMTRPLAALTQPPEYSGLNLALVAENYCNLSLRLGYHFNVIDSYISPNPDDNYIYFRFVGGMAEESKRRRRVELLAGILTGLHFRTKQKGDLLVAKAKMLAPEHMDLILARLGELIAFSRQLDVRMADDEAIERFFTLFLSRVRETRANGEGR